MREIWVRIMAGLTGMVVILLALLFAWLQNPVGQVVAQATPLPADVEVGRLVYQAQQCAMCHAIAGEGNPRVPLDKAALHLDAKQLREWILATGEAEEALAARTVRMKQTYRELPEDELAALVAYLQWVAQLQVDR